ncbi:LysR family transcriptional regulator [Falsigemmobacter intermedius]|uniref:LysR family transcriptional regulator n=1 Tax=Falsigemmobacter intermedius TaxID=1553448 RepID=UPI003F734A4A
MAFTLRQLQFFIAAAETRSVTGAARQLSISQSSVTEAIRALEEDLGIQLFERQARGMEITHKGQAFLRHARRILTDVSSARSSFRDETESLPGRLSLGVTSLVAGYVLSDILSRYRRAFPRIELSVIEENADYLEHLLIGGELDVAVLMTSSIQDRMAMHVETLLVSPYRLWLPMGHALADLESIELEALSGMPLIQLMVDEIEEITRRLTQGLGCARAWPFAPARSRRCARWWPPVRGWRSCQALSIAPGRWKATGLRPAMSRAICRRCRSVWPGGAAFPCPPRRRILSGSPKGPSRNADLRGEFQQL